MGRVEQTTAHSAPAYARQPMAWRRAKLPGA